jgi:hypothetical protein
MITKEQLIARSLELGLDMRDWEEPRIQQILNIVNEPVCFPKVEPKFKDDWWNTPISYIY